MSKLDVLILVRFGSFFCELYLFDREAFHWDGGIESRVPTLAADFIKIPKYLLQDANISMSRLNFSSSFQLISRVQSVVELHAKLFDFHSILV